MIKIITKYFFYLLAFTPFIGFFLRGFYDFKVAAITIFGNIALGITILLIANHGFSALKKTRYIFIGLLFAIYHIIWIFFNEISNEDVNLLRIVFADQHLLILFIFIVVENTNFSDKFIKNIVSLFGITIIFSFFVSLIQTLYNPFFFTPLQHEVDSINVLNGGYEVKYEMRNPSIFGYLDQNDFGLSFIPIISLFIGYYFYKKNKKSALFFLLIVLAGVSVLLTNGRYVMVCFIFLFFQLFFLKKFPLSTKLKYIFLIPILLIVTFYSLTLVGYNLSEFYETRIKSESASSRIVAFDMFFEFFPQNPLFGTGSRRTEALEQALYGRSSQIHVGYLSSLFEWGAIGSLILFRFWYLIVIDFYKKAKKSLFYGSFIAFLTFLISNLVLVQYAVMFYGLIFCFVFSKFYYDKTRTENIFDKIYI